MYRHRASIHCRVKKYTNMYRIKIIYLVMITILLSEKDLFSRGELHGVLVYLTAFDIERNVCNKTMILFRLSSFRISIKVV